MRQLIWFRQDLRVHDNPALNAALSEQAPVEAIFYYTPKEWQRHNRSAIQIDFLLATLKELQETLANMGVLLYIYEVPYFKDIAAHLGEWIISKNISDVYWNEEYLIDEIQRDFHIKNKLQDLNRKFHTFHGDSLLVPGSVRNKQQNPYEVFTPYKRKVIETLKIKGLNLIKKAPKRAPIVPLPFPYKIMQKHFVVEAGEKAALQRLQQFLENKILHYKNTRDFPALDGTSQLSPYLAIGSLSIKTCMREALLYNEGEYELGNPGITTWISELIWREFYRHIAFDFPKVVKHQAFKSATDAIIWEQNDEHFQKWCQGNTGVPIVDAAMRQLNETHWMHNRLRMITAMFLAKDLFLNWRLGERYFMQHLIDGDFASNNGGWQWCASTGTDAAPYFRIFNPNEQGKRFDKDAEFIKKYLPELKKYSPKEIHEMGTKNAIVNHSKARARVMDAFKKTSKK